MSKISEHIFGLYSQLVGDEIQPIDENVVDEAMGVINKIRQLYILVHKDTN